MRRFLPALALVAFAADAAPQSAALQPVAFEWPSLRMVVSPDSTGTWVWAKPREGGSTVGRYFEGSFVPSELAAWIPQARDFLQRPAAESDTGESRSTSAVRTLDGGRIFLQQQRRRGRWSPELMLVMQRSPTVTITVPGDAELLGLVIGSLEHVNGLTPSVPEAWSRVADLELKTNRHARGRMGNRPPPYPEAMRSRNIEGSVALSFVVGLDGKADTSSAVLLTWTHPEFAVEVLRHLPRLTFDPAVLNGAPVRERVIMPFEFKLYQGRGRPD